MAYTEDRKQQLRKELEEIRRLNLEAGTPATPEKSHQADKDGNSALDSESNKSIVPNDSVKKIAFLEAALRLPTYEKYRGPEEAFQIESSPSTSTSRTLAQMPGSASQSLGNSAPMNLMMAERKINGPSKIFKDASDGLIDGEESQTS